MLYEIWQMSTSHCDVGRPSYCIHDEWADHLLLLAHLDMSPQNWEWGQQQQLHFYMTWKKSNSNTSYKYKHTHSLTVKKELKRCRARKGNRIIFRCKKAPWSPNSKWSEISYSWAAVLSYMIYVINKSYLQVYTAYGKPWNQHLTKQDTLFWMPLVIVFCCKIESAIPQAADHRKQLGSIQVIGPSGTFSSLGWEAGGGYVLQRCSKWCWCLIQSIDWCWDFLRKVCGVHEDWGGAGNDSGSWEKMSLHQQKWQRRWWGWIYVAWKQSEGSWRCPHDVPWQQKDWIITNTIKSLGSAVHTSFRRYTLFINLRMNLNEWSLLLANRKEVFHFGVRPFFGDNHQYVLRHWAENLGAWMTPLPPRHIIRYLHSILGLGQVLVVQELFCGEFNMWMSWCPCLARIALGGAAKNGVQMQKSKSKNGLSVWRLPQVFHNPPNAS